MLWLCLSKLVLACVPCLRGDVYAWKVLWFEVWFGDGNWVGVGGDGPLTTKCNQQTSPHPLV